MFLRILGYLIQLIFIVLPATLFYLLLGINYVVYRAHEKAMVQELLDELNQPKVESELPDHCFFV
jgi:hypothetical protein